MEGDDDGSDHEPQPLDLLQQKKLFDADLLEEVFEEYDILNLGTVDHRLMPQLFRQLGFSINKVKISSLLCDYDHNADGDTSFKEFQDMVHDDRLVGLWKGIPRKSVTSAQGVNPIGAGWKINKLKNTVGALMTAKKSMGAMAAMAKVAASEGKARTQSQVSFSEAAVAPEEEQSARASEPFHRRLSESADGEGPTIAIPYLDQLELLSASLEATPQARGSVSGSDLQDMYASLDAPRLSTPLLQANFGNIGP